MSNIKSRKLNLVMNNLSQDVKDPTKIYFTMSILDSNASHNNVKVKGKGLESLAKSVKGMPIVAKMIVDENDRRNDDFGDHEASLSEDKYGNKYFERDTLPIGSFISDGYIVNEIIDGVDTEVLMGDGVLWVSRFPDVVNLVKEMFDSGIKINTSSEYKYDSKKSYFDESGVEVHDMDLYFEGTAVLGSDSNYVPPAYDSATFLALNQKKSNELNLLVAQAIKKEEGVIDLETKLNKVSYETIRTSAREQIANSLDSYEYLWIADVTNEDLVVAIEDEDYNVTYYQYTYSLNNDVVTVDLSSVKEVVESRQWKEVNTQQQEENQALTSQVNDLKEQLNSLNSEKEKLQVELNSFTDEKESLVSELNSSKVEKLELSEQLNKANSVIVKLNDEIKLNSAKIEELSPYKEKVKKAEFESVVNKAKEEFEAKFNSVEGEEVFATEEVQSLILNSVVDGEEGLNAKLKLSQMIIDLASKKLETNSPLDGIMNSKKQRDFSSLINKEDELLDELR